MLEGSNGIYKGTAGHNHGLLRRPAACMGSMERSEGGRTG